MKQTTTLINYLKQNKKKEENQNKNRLKIDEASATKIEILLFVSRKIDK